MSPDILPPPSPRETILQFGAGRFLRAFVALFVSEANAQGRDVGQIVVVQSTGSDRAALLNAAGGRYFVAIQGLEDSRIVNEMREATSVSRALVAATQWDEILRVAVSPDLRFIVSNTTEAGYALHEDEASDHTSPHSFPAKLLRVLKARFDADLPGVSLLPCELVENNASVLRAQVLLQADRWLYPEAIKEWLALRCEWRCTLVDRIVTERHSEVSGSETPMVLTCAEPFAFWAIETPPAARPFFAHPAIQLVPDVTPFARRKVRILNGAHTALAAKALPRGFRTVREAVENDMLRSWLHTLLFEEIVPALSDVEAPEAFARQTLERFANPFLEHKLADIAVNHEKKMQIRLLPTRDEYIERFGKRPPLLDALLEEFKSEN